MRTETLFDTGWLFHKGEIEAKAPAIKGPTYSSSKTERMKWGPAAVQYNDEVDDYRFGVVYNDVLWQNVTLPHDYIISGEVKKENNNALGFFDYVPAWYRKHFFGGDEFKDKRATLLFEGVASICTVYLNGCLLKHNFSGYNSFEIDITDYVKYGEDNVLAVHVEPNGHEGWWYEGGGIYRHVRLILTEKVAYDLWGVYIAPRKAEDDYRLETRVTVRNDGYEKAAFTMKHTVLDADNEAVLTYSSEEKSLEARTLGEFYEEALLPSPNLWDIDTPYLYTLVSEICMNGEKVDEVKNRFGCRDYVIDPDKGLFLNGHHVKIKGVCTHQDFGLTGKAVPDNVLRYKAKMMKDMGANGVRMSHYMHPAATMDALDELGFIVLDETRWFESTDEAIAQLDAVIKRDRNRPSVFMWSLGNEEPYHATDMGRRINKAMMAHARKLDLYRPMTSAVDRPPETTTISADIDLIGINYNHTKLDWAHETYPKIPVFSSECCATGTTRGHYSMSEDPARGYLPAYDRVTNNSFISREKMWKLVMERDWLFGAYQWIAFEHRGEAVWPRLCSQSGAIDLYLQKKDAFYQNLSHWAEYPVIHLLPHWNFVGREGEEILVYAYTNCPSVELFLNGESLEKVEVEKWGHASFKVPFESGKLEVVGYDEEGNITCRDARETTGRPVKLAFRMDCPADPNGRDLALFTCVALDEIGREVPDASPFIDFTVEGDAALVATGSDISDHTPVTCRSRKMRCGTVSVAVRPNEGSKGFTLRASSENLLPGSIVIQY